MTKQVHIEKEELEKYFAMHKDYDNLIKDGGSTPRGNHTVRNFGRNLERISVSDEVEEQRREKIRGVIATVGELPIVEVTKAFVFDSCHYLPYHNGKCKYLHGHTYHLEVTVKDRIDKDTGMVIDFGELKKIVQKNVVDVLDHSFFNDLIPYPTCEFMVQWIWKQLSEIKGLYRIKLYETDGSYCVLDKQMLDESYNKEEDNV